MYYIIGNSRDMIDACEIFKHIHVLYYILETSLFVSIPHQACF